MKDQKIIYSLLILFSLIVNFADAQVLYKKGGNPYGDLIANRIGDLVTVIIVQNASANQNAQSSKNRSAGLEASATVPAGSGFLSFTPDGAGSAKLSGKSQKSGSRTTTRQTNFVATVTARIDEVLENGNLKIVGRQRVAIDDQETEIFVSGIVRPFDINGSNTVISTALADAQIEYRSPKDERKKEGRIVSVIAFPFRFVGSLLKMLF